MLSGVLVVLAVASGITANPYRCTSKEWNADPAMCLARCGMEQKWEYFRGQVELFSRMRGLGEPSIRIHLDEKAGDRPVPSDLEALAIYFDLRHAPVFGIEPRYLGIASDWEIAHIAAHEVCHAYLHIRTGGWMWNGGEDNGFSSPRHMIVNGCAVELAGDGPLIIFLQKRGTSAWTAERRRQFVDSARSAYRKYLEMYPEITPAVPGKGNAGR